MTTACCGIFIIIIFIFCFENLVDANLDRLLLIYRDVKICKSNQIKAKLNR
ncbi:hypothetical protein ACSBR1_010829 [Camellia fascicularis]